jgi:Tfp pilus assembly protein PilF
MAGRPAPAPPLPRAWRQLPRLSAVPPGRLLLNFLDRNDEAEVALQAAIRLAPAHPGVLCNYAGFLHTTRLDFDGADRHYRMALAAKPDHVQTLSCYGSFKMRVTEEFEEAKVPLSRPRAPSRPRCLVPLPVSRG